MRRRIGIDVGGTNTDAVLLEDDRVLHAVKTPTTADVLTGDCEQVWSDNLIPLGERLQLLPSSSGLYDLDLSAI